MKKTYVSDLKNLIGQEVLLKGWVHRLRALSKTTFLVLADSSGAIQCVADPAVTAPHHLKLDDAVAIKGKVREEPRSKIGFEVDILEVEVLNRSGNILPFNASGDLSQVGYETILEHRPLSLRNELIGDIFKIQADVVGGFRDYLKSQRFTEIFTSKIVGGGTEGGTNLFEIKYFERTAYLAQSPQFFKEHGVCGLERVFETGHVYRAEPHATSRHLTEYYSLDFEMGFIDGPEEVIAMERGLLGTMFEGMNSKYSETLKKFKQNPLPDMSKAPTWEFSECLARLKKEYNRTDLIDDLDPEGERQLCILAEKETGCPAVFVLGFPLGARPFYTHPRGANGAAQSFDLLFRGLEITTGGQRIHLRSELEEALKGKGLNPADFEGHLKMFDLGMPPHGGLAIGAERLTQQILGLQNIREATMYPRDRVRVTP